QSPGTAIALVLLGRATELTGYGNVQMVRIVRRLCRLARHVYTQGSIKRSSPLKHSPRCGSHRGPEIYLCGVVDPYPCDDYLVDRCILLTECSRRPSAKTSARVNDSQGRGHDNLGRMHLGVPIIMTTINVPSAQDLTPVSWLRSISSWNSPLFDFNLEIPLTGIVRGTAYFTRRAI